MEFLLLIGGAIGISWVLGQVLKAIIKMPSTIVYHSSGLAERDKQKIIETEARNAKRAIEIEEEEMDRVKKQREAYILEVKLIQNSLKENGISENSLVMFRQGDSLIVDVAKYKELYYSFSYNRTPSFINAKAFGIGSVTFSKCIRYFVCDPVISVNVAKNKAFIRNDEVRCFDVPEYSIAKASPEFEAIYDEKVHKPLRDKAEAENAEKIKADAAKDKLDSIFK
nr:hypothetical protein [uncultured Limnohabitans sp.]